MELNRLYQTGGLVTALSIGHYLIQTIFGGDSQRAIDRKRHPNSFRALATRKDLRVKYTFLYYCVVVCEQVRLMPPSLAAALPLGHHKQLLLIKDVDRKIEFARLAAAELWSYRRLRDEIERFVAARPSAKKRAPPWVRGAALVTKGTQLVVEPRTDAQEIGAYGCAATTAVLAQLRADARMLLARCDELEVVVEQICADALVDA